MPSLSPNRSLAISQKIFQQLLCLYPKPHRHEYGAAMAQLFRDQSRDAWNESRSWGLAKLWLRTLPDLGKTSLIERISNFNRKKSMTAKMPSLFRPTPLGTFFGVFTVVFLLVLVTSIAITFILPESYASTARMQVNSDMTSNSDSASINAPYDPYFIQTTCEIVQSETVLGAVVERLNLNVTWGKKFFNGQTFKTSESIDILRGRIQVAPVRNTKILAVTVYSDDAKEAAQIANTIVESYKEYRANNAKILGKASQANAQIPQTAMVQIVDIAVPGRVPVKPNKPLNIFLGAVAGGFSGLIIGALSAFAAAKWSNRGRKNPASV